MTVIPAVVPADPGPASADPSPQPRAKPGFDHALAKAHDQARAERNSKPSAKPKAKANAKADAKPSGKGKDTDNQKTIADDVDAIAPKEVAALGDATVAALLAALAGNAAPATTTPTDASSAATNETAASTNDQPGITNVFAAAVAALTDAATDGTTATPSVGDMGAQRKDFVQGPAAAASSEKGRAIDLPPMQPMTGDGNASLNGTAHQVTPATTPAATNAAAAALAHAAEQSPVRSVAGAELTRNNESHAQTTDATQAIVAAAPTAATSRVDAPMATTETVATTPAPPPPPTEQLVAVMRPLQRTPDGSYRIRIELRPPELGRVDMRVEVKDGVVHASIHAEHAETADLVRNALDDLRSRLNAEGVRAGSLEVNDGRANDARREQQRSQPVVIDDPEAVTAPSLMTTRPLHQSDALLDVRI